MLISKISLTKAFKCDMVFLREDGKDFPPTSWWMILLISFINIFAFDRFFKKYFENHHITVTNGLYNNTIEWEEVASPSIFAKIPEESHE